MVLSNRWRCCRTSSVLQTSGSGPIPGGGGVGDLLGGTGATATLAKRSSNAPFDATDVTPLNGSLLEGAAVASKLSKSKRSTWKNEDGGNNEDSQN